MSMASVGSRLKLLHRILKNGAGTLQRRCLLTPSYSCTEEWNSRLMSPALTKVNIDYMISQLFVEFEKSGAATAIDMEVFANKIQDVHPTQLSVVETLLKKFRRSSQGFSVIESMSHAVIRAYIDLKQADRLLPIIQQKVDYGIFPDNQTFSLLLDHYIDANNLDNAIKVAFEMMLQEDFGHATSRLLALYACSQYLNKEMDNLLAPVTDDNKPTLDDDEEDYVVVDFIPSRNYDRHFDVADQKILLGKTLELIGLWDNRSAVYVSFHCLGLALHERFDKLFEFLEGLIDSPEAGSKLYKEVLDIIAKSLEACRFRTETIVREHGMELAADAEYNSRHTEEEKQAFISRFQELRPKLESCPLLEGSLYQAVEELVKSELERLTPTDIDAYKETLEQWNQQRLENVALQERAFALKERQQTLDGKIKELTEKEELLNYFVRQNDISLAVLRAAKPDEEIGEVDLEEYVAEPGKRGKKSKAG